MDKSLRELVDEMIQLMDLAESSTHFKTTGTIHPHHQADISNLSSIIKKIMIDDDICK